MRKKWLIPILFLLLATNVQAQTNTEATLTVAGAIRQYLVHLPPAYKPGTALPLVLIFHGGGGNYKQMQRYMNMDPIADRENFITVYPNGIDKQWNDGREFKESISANDDVLFINQLLDTLQKKYSINEKRIFSTGISNGGFFSIYLSYKLSHRLLGVAPVCASIPERIWNEFYPSKPVSILILNGTEDPLVPYKGGSVGNRLTGSRGNCTSTDSTVQRYISINATSARATISNLPNTNKKDGCTAVRYDYTGGTNGSMVSLIKINGGGHTLPGGDPYLPRIVGKVCNDFEGNEVIWEFFKGLKA